ncbi:Rod shape-determining protein MreC [hydrothermal vent metagenome]|uniref:Cell shape-determining protein MreC n=1 Tax=hydrothermal vent metagenome TaxID=652676 RepID=A0A3B0TCU4_9ZZZZ
MVLVFNYNNYQKVRFLNSSNRVSGAVYELFNSVSGYFNLANVNEELALENTKLRNELSRHRGIEQKAGLFLPDKSTGGLTYSFTSAKVIHNSVNKQYNYITLDKGAKDGVMPDRGIISKDGVIGILTNVSKTYSAGMSILNRKSNISAKLKRNNYFGSITWDGRDYRYVQLKEVPLHVELHKGDTIVTSGYSSYFPEGVVIGVIHSFEKKGGEYFYSISVELGVDFKSITYVDIINNLKVGEIKELEKLNGNEDMD